jgi:2Fe-2S ferredoxin
MATLVVTTREGREDRLKAANGVSVMEIIRAGGIDEVEAVCGGGCSCATCHVYVDDAFLGLLPKIQRDEDDLLDGSSHRTAASRLSCQILFGPHLDELRVTIAPAD